MASKVSIPDIRFYLYIVLFVFSFILMAICAARINYTEHLPRGDTLNRGISFYDPSVVNLLVTGIVTMCWSAFIAYIIFRNVETLPISILRDEFIGLVLLFLWWIIGASIASTVFPNLSFCQEFQACQLLSAMLAFAWLGWLTILAILIGTFVFAYTNGAFMEPIHGKWSPPARKSQTVTGGNAA